MIVFASRVTPRVFVLAVSGAVCFAPVAQADTFQLAASTTYSVDGSPTTTTSASTPSNAFPSVFESNGSKKSSENGKASSQLGTLFFNFGTRSQGDGVYSDSSLASYGQTFTTAARGRYTFNFTILGGDVSVYADTTTTAGTQSASLTGLITESVNGGSASNVFDYSASLSETGRAVPVFNESGGQLKPGGPTLAAGSGDYRFLLYTGSIDLGVFAQGEQVQINYTLGSAVSGIGTQCGGGSFARPFITVGPGDSLGCAGAVVSDLDPGGVGGPIPTITFTPLPVPEPAGIALLAVGAASVSASRERRVRNRRRPIAR